MTFIFILFSFCVSILSPFGSSLAFAQNPPDAIKSGSGFEEGLSSYEKKDFDQAIAHFSRALEQNPLSPSILTNLALAHFQKNQLGYALAYFKQALSLDPDFGPAKSGFEFVFSKLPVKEIPHRTESYESFRKTFLEPVSVWFYVFFGSFLFLVSGWLLIRYFGKRKKAFEEEAPLPPFPGVGALFAVGFVLITSLLFAKFYDLKISRGIIVASKSTVLTAPSAQASSLYEIPEGLEVIVQRQEKEWSQVTYPGSVTGWIPSAELVLTPNPL